MDPELRRAWMSIVRASDIDTHMSDNGQAGANSRLFVQMLNAMSLPDGASVLVPGAGTGQFLDFIQPESLRKYLFDFTDINNDFLNLLKARLRRFPAVRATVRIDDAEDLSPAGHVEAIVAVLLLEHVGWVKTVRAFAGLKPRSVGIVIQRNHAGAPMVTTTRRLAPSMEEFARIAHPHLVPEKELTDSLARFGYDRRWRFEEDVIDAKKMIGLVYQRTGDEG